jgi:hypothetical protein
MLSRPDFKASQCFAGLTAIDFFLPQGPVRLRLRVKGLRCRCLGTDAILCFANMLYSTGLLASLRLARSPLYAFRCLVLLYFDRETLTLVALKALSLSTKAFASVNISCLGWFWAVLFTILLRQIV